MVDDDVVEVAVPLTLTAAQYAAVHRRALARRLTVADVLRAAITDDLAATLERSRIVVEPPRPPGNG